MVVDDEISLDVLWVSWWSYPWWKSRTSRKLLCILGLSWTVLCRPHLGNHLSCSSKARECLAATNSGRTCSNNNNNNKNKYLVQIWKIVFKFRFKTKKYPKTLTILEAAGPRASSFWCNSQRMRFWQFTSLTSSLRHMSSITEM